MKLIINFNYYLFLVTNIVYELIALCAFVNLYCTDCCNVIKVGVILCNDFQTPAIFVLIYREEISIPFVTLLEKKCPGSKSDTNSETSSTRYSNISKASPVIRFK